MIKIENVVVSGWEAAIRGMRNPMNSWDKSDSRFVMDDNFDVHFVLGDIDRKLMQLLCSAGSDHRKFMRFIDVTCDIVAPLYWWKEFDTYKVGTVANSCSTMHKIQAKEITLDDFSIDNFIIADDIDDDEDFSINLDLRDCFINVVADCEMLRKKFIETKDKKYWRGLIQLLPESYNQRRTVKMNYEVLANMNRAGRRKDHKLDEWQEFCKWVDTLPYYKEITEGAR